jgi:hypothetical protein
MNIRCCESSKEFLMKWLIRSIAAAFLMVGLALAAAQPAAAQFTGQFGRVASEPFNGSVSIHNKIPGPKQGFPLPSINVGQMLDKFADEQVLPLIKGELKKMEEKNIGGGFRTYQLRLVPGQRHLFIGVDGTGFTVKYVITGNALSFKLRTPGPLPSGTDPRFTANFDVEVVLDVETKSARDITLRGGAKFKILNAKLRPRNFSARMIKAANDVLKLVGGPDFIGMLQAKANATEVVRSISRHIAQLTTDPKVRVYPTLVRAVTKKGGRPGKSLFLELEMDTGGPIVK